MNIKEEILETYSNAMEYTGSLLEKQFLMKNFTLALELANKDFEQWNVNDLSNRYKLDLDCDYETTYKVDHLSITIKHIDNTILLDWYDCEHNHCEKVFKY